MSDDEVLTPAPKRTRGPNKKKGKRKPRHVRAPAESTAPDAYAKIVSVKDVAPDDLAALQAQIKDLQGQVESERNKRTAAESAALLAAEAQGMLMQREIQEVATGKTVKVRRANGYEVTGYDGPREILKPKWKTVELPTFFYRIDLPPCGGSDLKINGEPIYHGSTIELDVDTLRTVKDIVYRCWAHDRSIHPSDENFYRRSDQSYQLRNARAIREGILR